MTSHGSRILFKPIQRIDPDQSKAAQIARRGPGLTVKFPRIDFDNLPSWPPLSDDEIEDDENGNIEEENDQRKNDVEEERLSTTAMTHPPSNESQPRAPKRQPSAPRETPSRASKDHFDSFIPARRKCPPPASRVSRNYSASNPLRDCFSRNESVACPVPSTPSLPSSPNRHRGSGAGETSPRNNSPFPITGTHASCLGSQMAAPSVSFATRSQSRPVRGNSHTSLVGNVGNNATSSRVVNAFRHAGNESSSSHIPTNAPTPAPARIAVAPEARQGEENRPNTAMQSTFRMAMELSKPYQPGLRAPNYHFAMVSGDSIHMIPSTHAGFPSAEPGNGQAHVAGDRDPSAGRNSNRELSGPMTLPVDRQVSPENGSPSPLAADTSSVDDDIPLGLEPHDEEQTDDDDSELARSSSQLPALLEEAMDDEEENGDENRTVSMSPAIRQRKQQEKQPQTNFQVNHPEITTAPAIVGQQPTLWNRCTVTHGDAMSTPHNRLTSENMARLDQQNAMWWKVPERNMSAAANSSRKSSAWSGLPRARDSPCPSRPPPTRCPRVNGPFVGSSVNHDENRQSLEQPVPAAPFRPRDSVGKVPKKRRRIVLKQEEDESMPARKR